MFSFQQNSVRHAKKQASVTHKQGKETNKQSNKNQATETVFDKAQMSKNSKKQIIP